MNKFKEWVIRIIAFCVSFALLWPILAIFGKVEWIDWPCIWVFTIFLRASAFEVVMDPEKW